MWSIVADDIEMFFPGLTYVSVQIGSVMDNVPFGHNFLSH
jgi:hypothetical protein